ncbi:MAG: preprotein translocase subunit SecY [Fimbriimonadaceae bacterium]|nr:preprotein translocase subunit SecY [Fimbriimonadaceae bacterium]
MNSGVFGGGGDKALSLPLWETLRLAWADPELRQRIIFVLGIFCVYVIGINVSVPIPGESPQDALDKLMKIQFFQLLDSFGGGALKRLSIFALGLNPYITSSIIMQILTTAFPAWKKEMQEGGEYARKQQNRRTRLFTLILCVAQSMGLIGLMRSEIQMSLFVQITLVVFWTAGAMFVLWLGEQISEKGIGNGVSLMIFAGIIVSMPSTAGAIWTQYQSQIIQLWQILLLVVIFVAVTWVIVLFTIAQRRIPIQHMRRQVGTKAIGGQTSYLPIPLNIGGVIPIIFAMSIAFMPSQFGMFFPRTSPIGEFLEKATPYLVPSLQTGLKGFTGCLFFVALIFFFQYFWAAIQFNVEDMSNNLKRAGSFIPGVRPGKQTRDFLDGVISRIAIVGAIFLASVALTQYLATDITGIQRSGYFFGTSILIVVSVALETMRQIEANLLMKQYGT